jgi:hypothetical protein
MEEFNILDYVKTSLGLDGTDFHDKRLTQFINDTKLFMASAGVKPSVINSLQAAGCIARGVSDLWDYGAGTAKFSPYFEIRVSQLALNPEEVKLNEILGGDEYDF